MADTSLDTKQLVLAVILILALALLGRPYLFGHASRLSIHAGSEQKFSAPQPTRRPLAEPDTPVQESTVSDNSDSLSEIEKLLQ
jgi:hypothetical protein